MVHWGRDAPAVEDDDVAINVDAYEREMLESEEAKSLTGDEPEHRPHEREFKRSVDSGFLPHCVCKRCRVIRAIKRSRVPKLTRHHASVLAAIADALANGRQVKPR